MSQKKSNTEKVGSKVLVVGANFRNKGAEAMAETFIQEANVDEVVLATIFEEDLDYGFSEATIIKHNRIIETIVKSLLTLLLGGFLQPRKTISRWRNTSCEVFQFLTHLREADSVVNLSGYALTDKFGTARIISWIETLCLSRLGRTPFYMFPQSVGPVDSLLNKILIRAFLPFAHVRSVRGSVSKRWLDHLGVNDVDVHPDIAFLLDYERTDDVSAFYADHDLQEEEFVVLVPNARLYERWEEYPNVLRETLSYLTQTHDVVPVLLPHEYNATELDDRDVIDVVLDGYDGPTVRVDQEFSTGELKAIISDSSLLIGSRLHSTVAGVSTATPTIALGWSEKYYEILEWIGHEGDVFLPSTFNDKKFRSQISSNIDKNGNDHSSLETIFEKARRPFELFQN